MNSKIHRGDWICRYNFINKGIPIPILRQPHLLDQATILHMPQQLVVASWSSGRVQDSGLGSRSSPEFNTLPVRLLVVPLSKALHTALLLSTQEQSGYLWGQICKPWRQVACERLYTLQGVEMDIQMDMECKGSMTREGTCQSLQSRALSLDVDSKQWLYFFYFNSSAVVICANLCPDLI